MHLHIIFVIYCILLITQGHAEPSYKCYKNVPQHIQDILLQIINGTHPDNSPPYQLKYVCGTAKKAFRQRETEGDLRGIGAFDCESNFDFNWETSLKDAVESVKNQVELIWGLNATRIGCGIRLSTDKDTGIHKLNLSCNYDKNTVPPEAKSPKV